MSKAMKRLTSVLLSVLMLATLAPMEGFAQSLQTSALTQAVRENETAHVADVQQTEEKPSAQQTPDENRPQEAEPAQNALPDEAEAVDEDEQKEVRLSAFERLHQRFLQSWEARKTAQKDASAAAPRKAPRRTPANDTIHYSFDEETKTLTFTGTGAMDDYGEDLMACGDGHKFDKSLLPPWQSVAEQAETIVISEGITAIGSCSFMLLDNLKTAVLPSTLESIGQAAFAFDGALETADLPAGLTAIGQFAFCGAAMHRVEVPVGVEVLQEGTFAGCANLEEVVLHEGLRSIMEEAFEYSLVPELRIPSTVESIDYTFVFVNRVYNLSKTTVFSSNWGTAFGTDPITLDVMRFVITKILLLADLRASLICDVEDVDTNVLLAELITYINEKYDMNLQSEADLEHYANFNGGTAVFYCYDDSAQHEALQSEGGKHYLIAADGTVSETLCPDCLTGQAGENITWRFDDATKTLIFEGFGGINDGNDYSLPWRGLAADTLALQFITTPEQPITNIGYETFDGFSKLQTVILPEGLQSVRGEAFYGCSALQSVSLPSTLILMDYDAFESCVNLREITVEEGNERFFVEDGCLYGPYSYTKSGSGADYLLFCPRTKTELTIPSGVCEITSVALDGCAALETLTLGKDMRSFDGDDVDECLNLNTIHVDPENTSFCEDDGLIYDAGKTIVYFCPKDKASVSLPETLRTIGWDAFSHCAALTSLTIPETVTCVNNFAFEYCSSLTALDFPLATRYIYYGAFRGCTVLESITFRNPQISISVSSSRPFPKGATIYAYAGSEAQTYAERYGNLFVAFAAVGSAELVSPPSRRTYYVDETDISTYGMVVRIQYDNGETVEYDSNSSTFKTSGFVPGQLGTQTITVTVASHELTFEINVIEIPILALSVPQTFTTDSYGGRDYKFKYTAEQDDTLKFKLLRNGSNYSRGFDISTLTPSPAYIGYFYTDYPFEVQAGVTYRFSMYTSGSGDVYSLTLLHNHIMGDTVGLCAVCGEAIPVIDSGSCGETMTYQLYEDGTLVINGSGEMTSSPWRQSSEYQRTLRRVLMDEGITSLCDYSFSGCNNLKEANLPSTVTSVGNSSFYECSSLQSIELPNGLTSIGVYAFGYCRNLQEVTIPDTVLSIGNDAFYYCSSLQSIELPSGLTSIGAYTFYSCTALKSITIPDTVLSIGDQAFYWCNSLQNAELPSSLASIGGYAFCGCSTLTEVALPETVTSIGSGVFSGCYALTDVSLPNGMTEIPVEMFNGCSKLESIDIPANVTTIRRKAFCGCSSLESITFPENLTTIEENAFNNSGLRMIEIPSGITDIGSGAFSGLNMLTAFSVSDDHPFFSVEDGVLYSKDGKTLLCFPGGKDSLEIPTRVETIAGYAFSNSSKLQTIEIPATVQNVNAYAFSQCSGLRSVTFGDGETALESYAFYYCTNLKTADLGGIKTIGDSAFRDCYNLETIDFGAAETIGNYAFEDCDGLQTLVIPASVCSIGYSAFEYCNNLKTVEFSGGDISISSSVFSGCYNLQNVKICGKTPTNASSAFYNCSNLKTIVLGAAVSDYNTAFNRSISALESFVVEEGNTHYITEDGVLYSADGSTLVAIPNGKTDVTVKEGVTSIAENAANSCSRLQSVDLPNTLETIGSYAFYGCNQLTSVDLGETISIESNAFYNCDRLQTLVIPESVATIGQYAFYDCDGLETLVIEGAPSIGYRAFYSCDQLASVDLGETTSIGSYAFCNCDRLQTLVIPESVATIGQDAFYDCDGLETLVIEGAPSIEYEAFYGCDQLVSVDLGETTSIGSYAFYNCDRLQTLVIPESVATIGTYAFCDCDGLETLVIEGAPSIEYRAFYSCDQLASIDLGETTSIGSYAFGYCGSLQMLEIPESVTSIGSDAFYSCNGLETLIFNSATGINSNAFSSCNNINTVTFTDRVSSIPNNVFNNYNSIQSVLVENVDCVFNGRCLPNNSTIYGYEGSTAETYASNYGNPFVAIEIDHIAVKTPPTNTTVYQHESLNTSGLVIEVTYNDGLVLERTDGFTVSGFDRTVLGTQTVTVTFKGKTTTFEVEVIETKLLTLGQSEPVEITYGGETRFFRFVPEETMSYVYYSTGSYNTYGYLYNSGMSQLYATSYGGSGNNFRISYTLQAGETYFLAARMSNSSTTGTFNVKLECATHAYEWVVDQEPTCGATGLKHQLCTRCGATASMNTSIPATGEHTYDLETVSAQTRYSAATCTEPAKYYYTCSVCGAIEKDVNHLFADGDPLGHDFTSSTYATNNDGTHKIKCTRCDVYGAVLDGVQTEGGSVDCTFGNWNVVNAPTCLAAGLNRKTCTACGYIVEEDVDPLGHDFTSSTYLTNNDGTHKIKCTRCDVYGAVIDGVQTEGGSVECSLGNWSTVTPATCEADGLKQRKCNQCGYTIEEAIPALGHSFTSTTYESNNDGTHKIKCARCDIYGAVLDGVQTEGGSVECSLGNWSTVTPATCEADGLKQRKCNQCGYTIEEAIPALGHSFTSSTYATNNDGTHKIKCTRCDIYGAVLDGVQTEGGSVECSLGNWSTVTPAACEEDGLKQRVCVKCGYAVTETIEKLGHRWNYADAVFNWDAYACETATVLCANCGESQDVAVTVTCVNTPVTCDVDGSNVYTATFIADSKTYTDSQTETLHAPGHDYVGSHVEQTGEDDGYTRYTCTRCGDYYDVFDPAAAVEGLMALAGAYQITLSWQQGKEASVTGYQIYRNAPGENAFSLLATVDGRKTLSYVDRNLTAGETYTYRVHAMKGEVLGAESEAVSAVPTADVLAPTIQSCTPDHGYLSGNASIAVPVKDDFAIQSLQVVLVAQSNNAETPVFSQTLSEIKTAYTFRFAIDTTAVEDGVYSLRVTASDACGNEVSRSFRQYAVNNEGPEQVQNLSAAVSGATQVVLRWDDVADDDRVSFNVYLKEDDAWTLMKSGIKETEAGTEKVWTLLNGLSPEATYTFAVAAVDVCGNIGAYSEACTFTTTSDTVAPVITQITPSSMRVKDSVNVRITAADPDGMLSKITLQTSVDGIEWNEVETKSIASGQTQSTVAFALALASYPDGSLFVRGIAKDAAGNTSNSTDAAPYVEYVVDTTAPEAPANVRAIGADGYVEIAWDDSSEADKNCFYVYRATSEDGEFTRVASSLRQTNWYDTSVSIGQTYYYKVSLDDKLGNMSTFSAVVSGKAKDDNAAPVLTLSGGLNGVVGGNNNRLYVAVTDREIDSVVVEYKTTGDYAALLQKNGIHASSFSKEISLPLQDLVDGAEITVRAYAVDGQGNRCQDVTSTLTVDNTAPTARDFTVALDGDTVTATWRSNRESDLGGYQLYCGRSIIALKSAGQETYSETYRMTGKTTGDYAFRLVAYDAVGNTSEQTQSVSYVNGAQTQGEITQGDEVIQVTVSAAFSCELNMETGIQEYFDASASASTGSAIRSYSWNFGDGSQPVDGVRPKKTFHAAGDYDVTLTVETESCHTATITKTVHVKDRESYGKVAVTVFDANGSGLMGVPVTFDAFTDEPFEVYTDTTSTAIGNLTPGYHTVAIQLDNFAPVHERVEVYAGKITSVKLTLTEEQMLTANFTVTRLSLDQIREVLGDDIYNEAYQQVYFAAVTVQYTDKPLPPKPSTTHHFDNGVLLKEPTCSSYGRMRFTCIDPGCGYYFDAVVDKLPHQFGEWTTVREPQWTDNGFIQGLRTRTCSVCGFVQKDYYPAKATSTRVVDTGVGDFVIRTTIPAKASFLNEFFEIRMELDFNATSEYELNDASVTLDLPESGELKLVDETRKTQSLGTIKGGTGQSTVVTWIVQGNVEGDYTFGATFQGTLNMNHQVYTKKFQSDTPIHIYGATAANMVYQFDEEIHDGDFYFAVGLKAAGEIDLNLPQIDLYSDDRLFISKNSFKEEGGYYYAEFLKVKFEHADGTIEFLDNMPEVLHPGEAAYKVYVVEDVLPEDQPAYFHDAVVHCVSNKDLQVVTETRCIYNEIKRDVPGVFNENIYIANIWLNQKADINPTPESQKIKELLNYDSVSGAIAQDYEENEGLKNAVRLWNGMNAVFSVGSEVKDVTFGETELYEALIFDLLNDAYEDKGIQNCATDAIELLGKGVGKISPYYNLLKDFLNLASVPMDMINIIYSENWSDCNLSARDVQQLNSVVEFKNGELLNYVSLFMQEAKSIADFFELVVDFSIACEMGKEMKTLLLTMRSFAENEHFIEAIDNIVNAINDTDWAAFVCTTRFAEDTGVNVVNALWSFALSKIPIVSALKVGHSAGKIISNLLVKTDGIIDAYKGCEVMWNFLKANRAAIGELASQYLTDRTEHNAGAYVYAMKMYQYVHGYDLDYALTFIKKASDEGIVNFIGKSFASIANAVFDTDFKLTYEYASEIADSLKNLISALFDSLLNTWKYGENYLQKDFPDIFAQYVGEDYLQPQFAPTITDLHMLKDGSTRVSWLCQGYYTDEDGRNHVLYGSELFDGVVVTGTVGSSTVSESKDYGLETDSVVICNDYFQTIFPKTFRVQTYSDQTGERLFSAAEIKELDLPLVQPLLTLSEKEGKTCLRIFDPSPIDYDNIVYEVYRKTGNEPYQLLKIVNRTTESFQTYFSDETIDGESYEYYVKAKMPMPRDSVLEGPESDKLKVYGSLETYYQELQARYMDVSNPGMAPVKSKIKKAPNKLFGIQLSWTANENANGYEIMRKASYGTNYVLVDRVDSETTNYFDSKVDRGVTYQYLVLPFSVDENLVKVYDASSISQGSAFVPEPDHTHTYEPTETIEPTCTEPGSVTYTCADCGDSYTETIDPLKHDWSDWTADGDNHTRSCQRDSCGEVVTLPHEWNNGEVTKEATCKDEGETTFTCEVCAATKTETIEKLTTHTPAEPVKENEAPSTYTEPGSYDEVVYCAVCGEELSRETVETPIADHEHQFESEVTQEPTCKEAGVTTYTCTLCGESYTETMPVIDHDDANNDGLCDMCNSMMTGDNRCKYCGKIHKGFGGFFVKIFHNIAYFFSNLFGKKDNHTHTYRRVVTEPTCTEGGYTTYTCTICGESYTDDKTDALGHDFGEWVVDKEATCEEEGRRTRVCARCETEEAEAIPMAAHVDEDGDGTCDACGSVIEDAGEDENPGNEKPDANVCAYCGKEHTGFFGGITKLIHNLLYKLGGKKK